MTRIELRFVARSALATIALLVGACTTEGVAESTTTQPTITTTATAPDTTIPDLTEDLEAALGLIEQLRSDLDQATNQRDEAERQLASIQAEMDALIVKYDAEIQQVIASGAETIVASVCAAIADGGYSTTQALVQAHVVRWADQPGLPDGADEALDMAAIEQGAIACEVQAIAAAEQAAADAEIAERQARLTEPKFSGIFVVGVDIAPGTWQATPDIQDCYWQRTDAQGEIIDNHFGSTGAGLTVNVRGSDYSVEFDGCGEWSYLG